MNDEALMTNDERMMKNTVWLRHYSVFAIHRFNDSTY
jgi:hypothetical protein